MTVSEIDYYGEAGISLAWGPYAAVVLPGIGGNLIYFEDVERGFSFLRSPGRNGMKLFKENPCVYGMPVLFPPNRIEDGTFVFKNRTYHFPINEPGTHNHLHGLVYNSPWTVTNSGSTQTCSYVELTVTVDEQTAAYQYFPHHFTIVIRYILSKAGLQQEVRVENHGADAMPCMLGFHTTVNVPFAKNSTSEDYVFQMTIGERWGLSDRMLPTGRRQDLTPEERKIKAGGLSPFYAAMDNHYTAAPVNGTNYMALTDTRLGVRMVYEVGQEFRNWMVWNNNTQGGFFCPEPQTCVVNAPNTGLSWSESGMLALGPGESWSANSRIYVEESR